MKHSIYLSFIFFFSLITACTEEAQLNGITKIQQEITSSTFVQGCTSFISINGTIVTTDDDVVSNQETRFTAMVCPDADTSIRVSTDLLTETEIRREEEIEVRKQEITYKFNENGTVNITKIETNNTFKSNFYQDADTSFTNTEQAEPFEIETRETRTYFVSIDNNNEIFIEIDNTTGVLVYENGDLKLIDEDENTRTEENGNTTRVQHSTRSSITHFNRIKS